MRVSAITDDVHARVQQVADVDAEVGGRGRQRGAADNAVSPSSIRRS